MSPSSLNNLALLSRAQGDYEEAQSLYEEAFEITGLPHSDPIMPNPPQFLITSPAAAVHSVAMKTPMHSSPAL
ncbi:MAG UNVERIFIED_CONTAM: tetratricopeptide repeat protein [Planctomycetaceae bacterium]